MLINTLNTGGWIWLFGSSDFSSAMEQFQPATHSLWNRLTGCMLTTLLQTLQNTSNNTVQYQ